jgi:acyl carrier protein
MTVEDKVRSALARELKRDPATITSEQALREDLGLNSLDAIELMFKVEEEFDLEIPDADLQGLRTVGDLVSYLQGRLDGAPPSQASAPPPPPPPASAPARPPATKLGAPAPAAKSRTAPAPAGDKRPAKRPRA